MGNGRWEETEGSNGNRWTGLRCTKKTTVNLMDYDFTSLTPTSEEEGVECVKIRLSSHLPKIFQSKLD